MFVAKKQETVLVAKTHALNARVYASETISCFVTMNVPNPLFQSKTHVLGGSMPFRSRT